VRATDLREGLRRDPRAEALRAGTARRLGPEIGRVVRGLDEDARRSASNLTLRELAALPVPASLMVRTDLGATTRGGERHPPRAGGDGSAGLDPKQPDVPA
jgi:hypothetical protein